MIEKQISSLVFFNYDGLSSKIWAFSMMQFAHKHISKIPGISFYKLMGSGKGIGFNPYPDWSTYALLIVWKNVGFSDGFQSSELFDKYLAKTKKITVYQLESLRSHGLWSNQNPFIISKNSAPANKNIAIITRATIKLRYLYKFWKYVPTSSSKINGMQGLLYTKGIGEVPVIQMATFSIWNSIEDVNRFAYQSKEHVDAIKMTRDFCWYSEELFARFLVNDVLVFQK